MLTYGHSRSTGRWFEPVGPAAIDHPPHNVSATVELLVILHVDQIRISDNECDQEFVREPCSALCSVAIFSIITFRSRQILQRDNSSLSKYLITRIHPAKCRDLTPC